MLLIYYIDKLLRFISWLCNKYVRKEYDSYHLTLYYGVCQNYVYNIPLLCHFSFEYFD